MKNNENKQVTKYVYGAVLMIILGVIIYGIRGLI